VSALIEQEWLHAVAGKALVYPAADDDTHPFVEAFAPHICDFHFNDLRYSTATDRRRSAPKRFKLLDAKRPDPALRNAEVERRSHPSRGYRYLAPSVLVERLSDGETEIVVRRRRGFGQYAMSEFADRSIGVFVHRCDSTGESGSNVWFLANMQSDHEPVSNLWDKLSARLADRAIIVSDGSLTQFKFLRRAMKRGEPSQVPPKVFGGFKWHCIGQMTDGRGGLVWGLDRQ
jgi:hypothetical protein